MSQSPNSARRDVGEADLLSLKGEMAFRLLVEAVQDYAIFLLSPDGTVLTWNRGAQRIKGYAADEIIGRHFSLFYTPEDREVDRPSRLLALAAEHGRIEDEGWRIRKDGTRFWADVILTALRDEGGRPYGFTKITRDLTERRAAEEQQRDLVAEQRARAAAEEALKARDRFLSIASHELKTPVASVRLAAESLVLARDSGRLDDDRLQVGLQRITTATERLGTLVDELLDVTRLTREAGELPTTPTDLAALVREVVDRFTERDSGRVTVAADGPVIWNVDASRIDQVVTNLVDNALKYSTTPAAVEVSLREAEGGVELTVADLGVGLDEATAARIFEAFGRGESSEHVPGLGLGLHITQQIVARHGGRIAAASRPGGHGSVFTVWLPGPTVAT